MYRNIDLSKHWLFHEGDVKRSNHIDADVCYRMTKAGQEDGDPPVLTGENEWLPIDTPHDWNTTQASRPDAIPSNGFKPRGIAWYRRAFNLPKLPEDAYVELEFEGVMGECVVYVNGILAARNESGYTAFRFDISDFVIGGAENTLTVSVDNSRWEGWWYEGAGIYRPVTLRIRPAVHVATRGVFVRTDRDEAGNWYADVHVTIENTSTSTASCMLTCSIISPRAGVPDGKDFKTGNIEALSSVDVTLSCPIANPLLWSPDDPELYTANITTESMGEHATDSVRFGVRSVRFTDEGMFLNDVKTPVNGICYHQDHAGVGIAITESLVHYRVRRMKEMGCNAVRCAHNCPSEAFLDACDELGLLVMAENRHFRSTPEVLDQLRELALISRNHPSVFLYSLFNEEPLQAEPRGRRMAERMLRHLKTFDDTRAVTAAMNGGALTRENASDVLDVAGFNYHIHDYWNYASRCPGKSVIATENGPLYATRGEYVTDPDKQVYDSYGETTAPFGQQLPETMKCVLSAPHVAGLFVWGAFDYRGEPQPFEWPSVFSHWGLTDACGFPKDTFYMLRSWYTDEPMVHLLPHWNFKEGENVRVCAMTNCEAVTLWLNGRRIGTKPVQDRRAEWTVPFEPGELRAVGAKGGLSASDIRLTARKPTTLQVTEANSEDDYARDSIILNIALTDENGTVCPLADTDRTVEIEVEKGRLIGSGNGDPHNIRPDIDNAVPTFHGLCQAIFFPDEEGTVSVTLRAQGLPPVHLTFRN